MVAVNVGVAVLVWCRDRVIAGTIRVHKVCPHSNMNRLDACPGASS